MRARLWLLLGAAAAIALGTPAATLSLMSSATPGQATGLGGQAQAAARRALQGLLPGGQTQPLHQIAAGTVQLVNYRSEPELTQGPLFYVTAVQGQTYDGHLPGRLPTGPWAPGDSYTRALVVRNTGNLDGRLTGVRAALRAGSSRTLADAIQLRLTADQAGQTLLASGSLGQFSDGTVALSSRPPLPAGGPGVTLYVQASLPRQAGNAYQNQGVIADFTATAEQGPLCGIAALAAQVDFLSGASTSPTGSALVNGDIFVDGDLSTTGNGRVSGTGAATGDVSGHVGTPQPHQAAIALPTVDWSALAGQARQSPNVYVDGDLRLSGSYSVSQPTLYYVNGDLTMSGHDAATVKGRVLFVVAGKVSITGTAALQAADEASALAIWSQGDASVTGNARLHGLVYTPATLSVTGNATLTGFALAGQATVTGNGTLNAQSGPYPCPVTGN